MKLAELKKYFQKKYVIRIVAGVLTIALAGTGVMVYTGNGIVHAKTGGEAVMETSAGNSRDVEQESLQLDHLFQTQERNVGKEETVYLLTDAEGAVKQTIVMDHLLNPNGDATIKDSSNLSNITNVKGKETYEQEGDQILWKAEGKDIYYRGDSDAQAPVSQKITYYLDGKVVTPEQLAGRSGKVTIRFDYCNQTSFTEEIEGEKVTVSVPFAAVTGMILDERFSNVEVTNGKVKTNGDSQIVIGYALPGLAESLDATEMDFSGEVKLPDYFEVSADVENFSLDMAMTVVVNPTDFTELQGIDTTKLDETIAELEDASIQLEDGSRELANGTDTLKDRLGDFVEGMKSLSSGLEAYTDGASRIGDGIEQIKDGVDVLAGSKDQISSGVQQLADGTENAAQGVKQLVAGYEGDGSEQNPGLLLGTKELSEGSAQLASGIDRLVSGMRGNGTAENPGLLKGSKQVADGAAAVEDGVHTLVETVNAMGNHMEQGVQDMLDQQINSKDALVALLGQKVTTENLDQVTAAVIANKDMILSTGLQESQYDALLAGLYKAQGALLMAQSASQTIQAQEQQLSQLTIGTEALREGAAAVYNGVKSVDAGVTALDTGSDQLSVGAGRVYLGAKQLSEGTGRLSEGLEQLDSGMESFAGKMPELISGITALHNGADQLKEGSDTLLSNTEDLLGGTAQLLEGTNQLADGVGELNDGAHQLADGMQEFNERAIDKMINSYRGDVKSLVNRIQAVLDAGKNYQIYSDLAEDTTGSVKFIYRVEGIGTDKQ